jgi:glyoxylase-like metal-dependent hydrolase (beta-lactamase superfamily II)
VPRKQEQENARAEVTEVAPNILRMQLPIRMPGLGHVNCYALIDDEGATLVDPGLPGPGTWRALQQRLAQAQLGLKDLHTLIVTHSHPDHFGGAARLQKEFGAKVVAHHSFTFGPIQAASPVPEVSVEDLAAHASASEGSEDEDERDRPPERPSSDTEDAGRKTGWGGWTPWGGSTPWGASRRASHLRRRILWLAMRLWGRGSFVPRVAQPVEHGDELKLAGRDFFVLHTPGHTPDHFCLHDPETGTLVAGDHVLPTITPHISGISSSRDPLASYFYSLDRVGEMTGVKQVLPAHGHPFTHLRARTETIKRHHHERLEKVKAISREIAPATVEAYSRKLFAPRTWGALAESETFAHLEHLRLAGEAERFEGKNGEFMYVTR